jgi:tetratricopeptide (TPR) repeat protein
MNCSATIGRVVVRSMSKWGARALRSGLLLGAVFAPAAQAETMAEIDDAAARMQYAFYTGDARAIEEVLALIEGFEVEPGLAAPKSYQLAYGYWKLAQLYLEPQTEGRPHPTANANAVKSSAVKAAQTCAQHAKAGIQQDSRMAELYAVEAACEGFSTVARSGGGSASCARSKSLKTALALEPENPRIKLIEALCATQIASDPASSDRWRAVVASFEAAPPSRPGKPDWGHVEALTLLGDSYLQRGDNIAARDALERALVLAPDYRQAQTLLQTAATRPR